MNKPEILSDEQIQKMFDYASRQDQAFSAGMSNEPCEPETLMKRVAQAQRDADVAYYEPLIQQARREVAEEIFEKLECLGLGLASHQYGLDHYDKKGNEVMIHLPDCAKCRIERLKAKYLE